MTYSISQHTRQHLISAIESALPRPHHHALLAAINQSLENSSFQHVLSKGGWYRVGSVLSTDGTHLGADLEDWVDNELEKCGHDFDEFITRYANAGLMVTRYTGRTHFIVMAYGPDPADFLQLEVEELQELWDRKLIDPDQPPQDRTSLVEPIEPVKVDAHPVGSPFYRFARLVDAAEVLPGRDSPVGRFLADWTQSRAVECGHFCEHWLLANLERCDPNNTGLFNLSLMSVQARTLTPFQWDISKVGVALGDQLREFDRAAGYPGAWYFHLLASKIVPGSLPMELLRDRNNGYEYLADKDLRLLDNLVAQPYCIN